jgi:uncharacterized protein YjbI with pentapeptide repeats
MVGVGDWTSASDFDPPAGRAAVSPRVHLLPGGGAALSLETLIRNLIDQRRFGQILLLGRGGGGKSTAVNHLRAVLPPDAPVVLYDEPPQPPMPRANVLAIVAHREEPPAYGAWLMKLELAPWEQDDCIEYCAARRRDQCSAVLARLKNDQSKTLLRGSPQLWRIALDRLGADETVPDTVAALREHIAAVFPPQLLRDKVAPLCLAAVADADEHPVRLSELPRELLPYALKLLRHRAVRVIVAADLIATKIGSGAPVDDVLCDVLPEELLHETASALRFNAPAVARLDRMLSGRPRDSDAMAASLLLAIDPAWRPRDGRGAKLSQARLAGAKWPNVDLRGAELKLADLREADLSCANLKRANACGAILTDAKLLEATLRWLRASAADFSGANFIRAVACSADFSDAELVDVDLRDADLSWAVLNGANLAHAKLVGTKLRQAKLLRTNFEDADLIGVDFQGASLDHVNLAAAANVAGLSFPKASLLFCELEGLRLPEADFAGANLIGSYLTGTFMPLAKFNGANLRNTGLAEIEWEGADLRNADLRGCTFHMGSTRSGLVSVGITDLPPCEGSRTGFYIDDFADRDFKPPEEIRKADLRSADLRGANIEGVDFYLVDLRGAMFTPAQAAYLEKCGAILDYNS